MISRDDLYFKLLHLVPDAKFSFWVDDRKEEMGDPETLVKMLGYVVAWSKENTSSMPSRVSIESLDINTVMANVQVKQKQERNKNKADDLSLVASFNIEKKANPALEFSDYVDQLETDSAAIKNAEATPIGDV
jgi:hypothetical protein